MNINTSRFIKITVGVAVCLLAHGGMVVQAANGNNGGSSCNQLPSYGALRAALVAAQSQSNGGFGLNMWATVVNRDWSCLRGGVYGQRPRIAVAGKPRDLSAEGEYGECVQPAGAGAIDCGSLQRDAAGRDVVRTAGE